MEVPFDVATVGWYRFGPGPGSGSGSAVLSGHVDDREQGFGAFHRLGDLAPGDPVAVELADGGRTLTYRVESVTRIPKADLPVAEVFSRGGPPRLTLVTCGGPFDYDAHGYRDNVVVVARPDGL
jgi:LPXTG-site transpeptidase (sortase) family protein